MTVAPYPEFFNDVFGPVMQPGSSSHTAGPCRLGLARRLTCSASRSRGCASSSTEDGSFAGTFGIMAEDRAMVAGVLGYLPDDARLFRSFELAEEAGVDGRVRLHAHRRERPPQRRQVRPDRPRAASWSTLVGDSTGGGMVETVTLDGFPCRTLGDAFVLLVQDPQETLQRTSSSSGSGPSCRRCSTAQTVRVEGRGVLYAFALSVEPDLGGVPRGARRRRRPSLRLALLRPLLPVVCRADRKPQLFDTMTRWRELAAEREASRSGRSPSSTRWTPPAGPAPRSWTACASSPLVMRRQTRAVYEEDVVAPDSQFKPDFAGRWVAARRARRRA